MAKHSIRKIRPRWGRIALSLIVLAGIVTGCALGVFSLTNRQEKPDTAPVLAARPSDAMATASATVPAALSPLPTSGPTPEPLGKVAARIRATGDLMAHQENLEAAKRDGGYDFTSFFEAISPSLMAADLTIGNLEVTVSDSKTTIDDSFFTGYPAFRSPGSYLDALAGAGFDVLTIANNHIVDKGFSGIEATVAALEARGIPYAGAYADERKSKEILLRDVGGVKVAVLAYAEYTNANTDVAYAVSYLKEDALIADAKAARDADADIIIAMVHWGIEYDTKESENQRLWAQRMCDAGVDIVLGSHPHVVQPAEWIDSRREDGTVQRTFVAYSMGNFISNQRTEPRDAGIIYDFQVEKDLDTGISSILEVSYIPTWVLKGSDGGKPTFTVLPAGAYREEEYPGLVAGNRTRLLAVWDEIRERVGQCGATALEW